MIRIFIFIHLNFAADERLSPQGQVASPSIGDGNSMSTASEQEVLFIYFS